MPTNAIDKVRYTHEAMIDILIAQPGVTQNEIARHFGYTPGWISQVMSSDAFKEALAKRRNEVVNPELVATIEERLENVAKLSMSVLAKKMQDAPDAELALRAMDISTRALGYGAKQQGVTMNAQFVVAMPEKAATKEVWLNEHSPHAAG